MLDAAALAEQERRNQAAEQATQTAMSIFTSLSDIAQEETNQQQTLLNQQLEDGLISQEEYETETAKLEKKTLQRQRRRAMLDILINTAQGISKAIQAGAGIPFPANLGAIASGVATVLAGIASAKGVLSDAGGDEPDTPDSVEQVEPAAMGALVPNMETVEQPEIGGSTVQAYVVEQDISNAQALQEELEVQATL